MIWKLFLAALLSLSALARDYIPAVFSPDGRYQIIISADRKSYQVRDHLKKTTSELIQYAGEEIEHAHISNVGDIVIADKTNMVSLASGKDPALFWMVKDTNPRVPFGAVKSIESWSENGIRYVATGHESGAVMISILEKSGEQVLVDLKVAAPVLATDPASVVNRLALESTPPVDRLRYFPESKTLIATWGEIGTRPVGFTASKVPHPAAQTGLSKRLGFAFEKRNFEEMERMTLSKHRLIQAFHFEPKLENKLRPIFQGMDLVPTEKGMLVFPHSSHAVHPKGKYLLVGHQHINPRTTLIDLQTEKPIATMKGYLSLAAFSEDHAYVSGLGENRIVVVDLKDPRKMAIMTLNESVDIRELAWIQDSGLGVITKNGELKVFRPNKTSLDLVETIKITGNDLSGHLDPRVYGQHIVLRPQTRKQEIFPVKSCNAPLKSP